MTTSSRWLLLPALTSALLPCLLLMSGCAAAPGPLKPAVTRKLQFAYQAAPSSIKVDASATIEATVAFTPEIKVLWQGWSYNDQMIAAYLQAVASALKSDLANSGLFSRTIEPGAGKPDFQVKILAEEHTLTDLHFRVSIHLIDPASGRELFVRTADFPLGLASTGQNSLTIVHPPGFPADEPGRGWSGLHLLTGSLEYAAEQVMPVMKAGMGQFLKSGISKSVEEQLRTATLSELLVPDDTSTSVARARNRAIIAAKTQQMPALLRETKSDELSALVVRVEQTILDLNHESEVAKDHAQQVTVANGDPQEADELRGLGISYRERIELLKPILTALKEEIANRNR